MNNLLPPPPPSSSASASGAFSIAQIHGKRSTPASTVNRVYGWEIIQPADISEIPCQRSLHAGAVWRDYFVVFGGYDGLHRVNDLHAFHFPTSTWRRLNRHNAPSPRDRHVAVVYEDSLYIFGGFDGSTRVNGKSASSNTEDGPRLQRLIRVSYRCRFTPIQFGNGHVGSRRRYGGQSTNTTTLAFRGIVP